ncbi:hypothetical protein [Streptomyces sp. NBRC 110028]|uniref:hypothetical protein n=1 Tax=Streptomyces sp. NBRC 110028 TaxID=1621260 RepID=UPI0006E33F83|nr:hypothetical protein [Streptomyces sp. NBRC 110028]
MTVALTVDTTQVPGLAEVTASLPLSLAPASSPAQLAAVTGAPGWAERAEEALAGGAVAVVVESPSADNGAARLGVEAAAHTVLGWAFAANPGVLAAGDAAGPLRERAVFADAQLRVPAGTDLDAAMLDLLTATSRVAGAFGLRRTLHRDRDGWHAAGRLDTGAPLSLSVVVSNAAPASLRLRLLTADGGLTAAVPAPDTAAPAEVRILTPDGERLLPTLWETSRRASWRRAVAIATGATVCSDVAELHRITALAVALRG